jgi:mono/diheme cytochrome c family protein
MPTGADQAGAAAKGTPMTDIRYLPTKTGWIAVPLLAAVLLADPCIGLAAPPGGDVDAGHQLAETWCSSCHVVGRDQQSATSTGAPTFTAIAVMKTTTPLGLRVFFQTPHHRMPDLHLSNAEMDNVIAYIISLQR